MPFNIAAGHNCDVGGISSFAPELLHVLGLACPDTMAEVANRGSRDLVTSGLDLEPRLVLLGCRQYSRTAVNSASTAAIAATCLITLAARNSGLRRPSIQCCVHKRLHWLDQLPKLV